MPVSVPPSRRLSDRYLGSDLIVAGRASNFFLDGISVFLEEKGWRKRDSPQQCQRACGTPPWRMR